MKFTSWGLDVLLVTKHVKMWRVELHGCKVCDLVLFHLQAKKLAC